MERLVIHLVRIIQHMYQNTIIIIGTHRVKHDTPLESNKGAWLAALYHWYCSGGDQTKYFNERHKFKRNLIHRQDR
jgi:hypothetical protein